MLWIPRALFFLSCGNYIYLFPSQAADKLCIVLHLWHLCTFGFRYDNPKKNLLTTSCLIFLLELRLLLQSTRRRSFRRPPNKVNRQTFCNRLPVNGLSYSYRLWNEEIRFSRRNSRRKGLVAVMLQIADWWRKLHKNVQTPPSSILYAPWERRNRLLLPSQTFVISVLTSRRTYVLPPIV